MHQCAFGIDLLARGREAGNEFARVIRQVVDTHEIGEIFGELAIDGFGVTLKKVLSRLPAARNDDVRRQFLLDAAFGLAGKFCDQISAGAPVSAACSGVALEISGDAEAGLVPRNGWFHRKASPLKAGFGISARDRLRPATTAAFHTHSPTAILRDRFPRPLAQVADNTLFA